MLRSALNRSCRRQTHGSRFRKDDSGGESRSKLSHHDETGQSRRTIYVEGMLVCKRCPKRVFSALVAREGMTGPSPIFEGEMGFFKQVSGPFEMNIDDFGGRNGSFKIAETYLKFFPAEIHSQTSIWAALEARREIGKPEDIVSVEIASHEAG